MSPDDVSFPALDNGEVTVTEPVRLIDIRDTPLSVDEVLRAVTDRHAGGIDLLIGAVRDHTPERPGEQATEPEHSAHPTARDQVLARTQRPAPPQRSTVSTLD